jgi:CBS domain-containing protein
VARALLWRRSGDITAATKTAAVLGRAFGSLLIGLGVLMAFGGAPGGLWFALIGAFLVIAASAERVQEQVVSTFTGVLAEQLMSHPAITIPADLTLAEAQQYFARYRYTAFPVTDRSGRAIGMLSIDHLERTPRSRRSVKLAGERADRDPALLIGQQEDVAHLLQQPAFARVGRAAVIDDEGRPVGVVSLTDIQRTLRANRLRSATSGPASAALR